MSTIKLNGSSGISGYEADNTTLIIEKGVADLVGVNPEAFPSSQTLTLQNGVKVDGTVTPPILRFRDRSTYVFQGIRQVVLPMRAEYDTYKGDPFLTYDTSGALFQGTLLNTYFSTVGINDWWQGNDTAMRFIGCGNNLLFTTTTIQLQGLAGQINSISLKSNVLNITIKAPDGTVLHSAPPVPTTVLGYGYDLEQISLDVNTHMKTVCNANVPFVYGYTLTLDIAPS